MNSRVCVACAVLVAGMSSPAFAEPRRESHSSQVGASVEWSSLVGGWGGASSFRRWRGRLGIDVGGAVWRSRNRFDFPGGSISALASRTGVSAGVSILGRARAGRVAAIAGAGPALLSSRIVTRTTFDGVEGSVTRTRSSSVGLRFLFDLEADLTRRLSGFVGARVELLNLRHPGLGSGALSVGMRARF